MSQKSSSYTHVCKHRRCANVDTSNDGVHNQRGRRWRMGRHEEFYPMAPYFKTKKKWIVDTHVTRKKGHRPLLLYFFFFMLDATITGLWHPHWIRHFVLIQPEGAADSRYFSFSSSGLGSLWNKFDFETNDFSNCVLSFLRKKTRSTAKQTPFVKRSWLFYFQMNRLIKNQSAGVYSLTKGTFKYTYQHFLRLDNNTHRICIVTFRYKNKWPRTTQWTIN